MVFVDSTTQYAAAGTVLALLALFLLYQPNDFVRWLKKKNYQYEVTFSLYMLTPTEKFVFNSILFLTVSMFTLACVLYLPNHLYTILRRTSYYFAGDSSLAAADSVKPAGASATASQLAETVEKASQTLLGAATDLAAEVYDSAAHSATAVKEAVGLD